MLEVRVKRKLPGFNLDVAFSVNQEILTILGPSGSGKTMTLQCIAGLITPDEGYIKLNDKVLLDSAGGINLQARIRKVGFVFQNYALFQHLTVSQNIGYGIRHLTKTQIRDRISGLLEKMNIQKFGDRYPRQLSAGQQQRVAVARALAPEPEVLLLDEPFSALDSLVRERMQLELQALQSFYKGNILFVTHDLMECYKLGSRIAVFEQGRIVQQDDKEKVIFYPSNRTVARLVGFKNLMEGLVIDANDSAALIKVPEFGGSVRVIIPKSLSLSAGQPVIVGIRPEYVQLKDQLGENTISSKIDTVVKGVTITEYYLRMNSNETGGHRIVMTLQRSDSVVLQEGQSGYVYLPAERLVVIED